MSKLEIMKILIFTFLDKVHVWKNNFLNNIALTPDFRIEYFYYFFMI